MTGWTSVVTQPLGLVGFALFLVFGYLAKVKSRNERRWLSPVAVIVAVMALGGGLVLAYVEAPKSLPTPAAQAIRTPAQQQTNNVQQTTSGQGSPAVQGVQGDVTITVDQSGSGGKQKKSPDQKADQKGK